MYDFNINPIIRISGNKTTISTKPLQKPITPINTTSTVTANLPQKGNKVPRPPKENVEFTKECVDENHK